MAQLKNYLQSNVYLLLMIPGGLFAFSGLCGIVQMGDSLDSGLVMFVAGSFMLAIGIYSVVKFSKYMKMLQSSGQINLIIEDFEHASTYVNGKIRMGQYYVFGKSHKRVVAYNEIRQVYQHIIKRNGIENERYLEYVDSAGKAHKLCTLKRWGKSEEEMVQIIGIILQKNPNVRLGYK